MIVKKSFCSFFCFAPASNICPHFTSISTCNYGFLICLCYWLYIYVFLSVSVACQSHSSFRQSGVICYGSRFAENLVIISEDNMAFAINYLSARLFQWLNQGNLYFPGLPVRLRGLRSWHLGLAPLGPFESLLLHQKTAYPKSYAPYKMVENPGICWYAILQWCPTIRSEKQCQLLWRNWVPLGSLRGVGKSCSMKILNSCYPL